MKINTLKNTSQPFLTDGGLETSMIFDDGFDLPYFASFTLLETAKGRVALWAYYNRFIDLAEKAGRGFVLDTTTWRANLSWGVEMNLSREEVLQINTDAVAFADEIRKSRETPQLPIVVNGIIGPAGDGYAPDIELTAEAAQLTHAPQIHALGKAGVDMITALTITHAGEATGITAAAGEIDLPTVISFTLETDGRLPSGQELGDAIAEVDAATNNYPLFYMINCAHPDHFNNAVAGGQDWTKRIGGIRANASRMSHAELDVAEELDAGDPIELGAQHKELLKCLPNIRVLGGCCGTNHQHVSCIAANI